MLLEGSAQVMKEKSNLQIAAHRVRLEILESLELEGHPTELVTESNVEDLVNGFVSVVVEGYRARATGSANWKFLDDWSKRMVGDDESSV
jgi:hypothetical protein